MENLLVPEKPYIQKPADPELLAKLQAKLSEYALRMFKDAGGLHGNFHDAAYKHLILNALLKAPEGGKISQVDLESKARNESKLLCIKPGIHVALFRNAWTVVYGYVHERKVRRIIDR